MSFLTKLAGAFPPASWQEVTVVVAVSGGADSVALLRGLAELKGSSGAGRLIAAHFNHRLRGSESDADEEFVRQLDVKWEVPLEVAKSSLPLNSGGDGIEAAARTARYGFLTETAHRVGARYLVTAHTADDQVETVLQRILRGTGIGGLAGIPKARQLSPGISLLRPLLSVTRAEVLAFLGSLDQPFREDSSNNSFQFTRNRLRHELLPQLEKDYAPALRSSLLRLSRLAEENQELLASLLAPFLAEVQHRDDSLVLNCAALAPLHRHLLRELLLRVWSDQHWPQQDMTLEKWDQLAALIQQPATSVVVQSLPGGIRAERVGEELRLSPPSS